MRECLRPCPAQHWTHSRRTYLANTGFLRRTTGPCILGATVFIVSGARGHHLHRLLNLCGKVGRKVPESTESPCICGKALGRLGVGHLRPPTPAHRLSAGPQGGAGGGWGSPVSQQNWVFQVDLLPAPGLLGFMVPCFRLN